MLLAACGVFDLFDHGGYFWDSALCAVLRAFNGSFCGITSASDGVFGTFDGSFDGSFCGARSAFNGVFRAFDGITGSVLGGVSSASYGVFRAFDGFSGSVFGSLGGVFGTVHGFSGGVFGIVADAVDHFFGSFSSLFGPFFGLVSASGETEGDECSTGCDSNLVELLHKNSYRTLGWCCQVLNLNVFHIFWQR
jgi:hypothetical protein